MDSLVNMTPLFLLQRILLVCVAASTYQFYVASPSSTFNSTSTDGRALLAFKSLLFDPHNTLSSWNVDNTLNVCDWHGIGCQSEGRSLVVTALRLESLGLTGMISPAIAGLTFLRVLHLPYNQLNGSIPRELGDLPHLRYLNLTSNALEGAIPDTLSQCFRLHTISIGSNKLQGSLPPSMARCSRLRIIDFDDNLLTGEIPDEYKSLPELLWLFLSNNNLSGSIPAFGSNSSSSLVTRILLSNNSLTGQIPQSLGNLSSLTQLYLSENYLVGRIPPSLGYCMNLTDIFVRKNHLEGNIPDSLGQLTRLRYLELSTNHLSGVIPLSLYNLSSLVILDLAINRLVGTIPPNIFQAFPELKYLSLSCNNLQGSIPKSFSNASQLLQLDLSDNSLSGVIPSNLGHLNNLVMLGLAINRFEAKEVKDWDFFTSLANCTNLNRLFLSHNYLAGNFPTSIGNLSSRLGWLAMSGLQISGAIPPEIGKLRGLQFLDLSENFITSSIPSTIIAGFPNLTRLYLFRNRLSGHIPEFLGNLTRLEVLQLGDNDLHGNIPSSLSACNQLNALNVSFNRLNGSIPNELVKISSLTKSLDLSHNYFTGPIPSEVDQLNLLSLLDISENELSGELPVTLGSCVTLNSLSMEGNSFRGAIPWQLRNLRALQRLDISRNNFSGQIPEFLAEIESLQYLNISFNDFEGSVPIKGVFANTSEIFTNGNSRLCGGAPALQLPSCLEQSSKAGKFFNTPRIVMLAALCFILVAAIIILRKKVSSQRLPRLSSSRDQFTTVSYSELHKATDGFSSVNLIGTGNFSSVYKGNLDGYQNPVAVKVLNLAERGALKSYMAECEALKTIRHRNLVKILTCCSSIDHRGNDFKALVLEFVPDCSLEDWLHPKHPSIRDADEKYLCLEQRLKIAIDIASALEYLHHHHGQTPIVHCDVKPSNILLDCSTSAKLGDFGLTKFIHGASSATTEDPSYSIAVKGSIGYIPPEYGIGGKVSTHGDAYSYGILLLEMVTGKRPTDEMFYDGRSLRSFVEELLQNVAEIVDPVILSTMGDDDHKDKIEGCLTSMVEIGLSCSREAPDARMDMKTVTTKMAAIQSAYLGCDSTSR